MKKIASLQKTDKGLMPRVPWNKGRKMAQYSGEKHWNWQGGKPKCMECGKQLKVKTAKRCQKHANLILLAKYRYRGEPWNKGSKGVMPAWNKGKHIDQIRGENHYNWKGGITSSNDRIRKSLEYRLWRQAIFQKDDYTCQLCGIRGGYLEADHIKPFAEFPHLQLSIENGQSLHKVCHRIKGQLYKKHSKIIEDVLFQVAAKWQLERMFYG